MNLAATPTAAPALPLPSEFNFSVPKLFGRQAHHTLDVFGQGTTLIAQHHGMWDTTSETLDETQIAALPDVRAGVDQLKGAWNALTDADRTPRPIHDIAQRGEMRFSLDTPVDGERTVTFQMKSDNPRTTALADAVQGLMALVTKHGA
jgi:hypothetical protein